jgi:putative transcriptional regulator
MIKINLGNVLTEKNLSQRQAALISGVRPNTLSLLCKGDIRRIDLDVLDRICTALEVQPAQIIEWMPSKDTTKSN